MANRKLTLTDITDLRAYERERDAFRSSIIELKKRRRVQVGPFITFIFENRDTMRFQIQEMARAERMLTDDAIQNELAAYNPLIPLPGELSTTMFIELTSEAELREWLPNLVAVERHVELAMAHDRVAGKLDAAHAEQLTREDTTASVHYLKFGLSADQVEAFAAGPAQLTVRHPRYDFATTLSDDTRTELLRDLRSDGPGPGEPA